MFAVQCSFCGHENTPGARYCAECGSPLHLRVCPNSACGKVSDVNAKQCQYCGTFFPEIALADPVQAGASAPPSADTFPPLPPLRSATSPWPLIVIAVVAGGLPLLWINRAHLPMPTGWQAAKPEVPPLVPPAPLAQPPEAPTSKAVEPESPPAGSPAPALAASAPPPAQSAAPSGADRKPSPPCTEAVATLGLCSRQAAKK